mmetsp:Transcript_11713/g.24728  ORF Transcript_11713/g.24728 Transcript_11713/m.24728 type:complete len:201 (-) Transcript_11713:1074-1676(-)
MCSRRAMKESNSSRFIANTFPFHFSFTHGGPVGCALAFGTFKNCFCCLFSGCFAFNSGESPKGLVTSPEAAPEGCPFEWCGERPRLCGAKVPGVSGERRPSSSLAEPAGLLLQTPTSEMLPLELFELPELLELFELDCTLSVSSTLESAPRSETEFMSSSSSSKSFSPCWSSGMLDSECEDVCGSEDRERCGSFCMLFTI